MIDTHPSLLQRLREEPTDDDWIRFDELYRPFLRDVLLGFSIQSHDVEDLINEVLLIWIKEVKAFNRERNGALRTWLRVVARRCFLDLVRKNKRWRAHEDLERLFDQLADSTSARSRLWDSEHDRRIFRDARARIEPEFQAKSWLAFAQVCLEGQDCKEVANRLGMTVGAIHVVKCRILARLKTEVAEMIEDF